MMQPKQVKIACFSPTGTTRKVLEGVARGLGEGAPLWVDVTGVEARSEALQTAEGDLLLIGAPVYMGRIPGLLEEWLAALRGNGTPAVCVVVYGNRVFDDALLELGDAVAKAGCVPVAGAAFIGEHSFSSDAVPTAHGRPDADDLALAEAFGRDVRKKLASARNPSLLSEPAFPGNRPYGSSTTLWDVDFIAVSDDCVQCGVCAEVCPVGAVDPEKSDHIDTVACITCCACIKKCPRQARSIKPGPVLDAQKRLNTLFAARREPETFL